MNFPKWARRLLGRHQAKRLGAIIDASVMPAPLPSVGPRYPGGLKIAADALSQAGGSQAAHTFAMEYPRAPAPEWVPENATLAMDDALQSGYGFASLYGYGEGVGWLGFPYLAELTQRPEYRLITETRAKEMTRKWIKLTYKGDEDKEDLLEEIANAMDKFKIRDVFRVAAEHDGFYGRGQIFIDTGVTDKRNQLMLPLVVAKETIKKGSVKAFTNVEPFWSYPGVYNAIDPLKPDFFRPVTWFVMNKIVHRTRLLTLISAEVPDILKAAYSFSGVSLSQRAKPYVDNWLRTRQSVSDLLHSFSIVVLKTLLQAQLGGDPWSSVFQRIDVFNATRDNRGTMVIDKETEEMENLAVPLGTLDALQAQAQEQMASISQTPLVKLLGVTPSGLNASSDGEIRVYYDNIHAIQEHLFQAPLKTIIDIIQLNETGAIDPNVGFEFVSLWELDEVAESSVRKTNADTAAVYLQEGVVSAEEVRQVLADDESGPFGGINPDDVPEPPESDFEEGISGDPAKSAESKSAERSGV